MQIHGVCVYFPFLYTVYHMVLTAYPAFHCFVLLYGDDVLKINPSVHIRLYRKLTSSIICLLCYLCSVNSFSNSFFFFNGFVLVFGQHE